MKKIPIEGGKVYGHLVILREGVPAGKDCRTVVCRCLLCGAEKTKRLRNVKNGHTKSCGCLIEKSAKERFTTHGHCKGGVTSKTFVAWSHIIQRTTNNKIKNWHRYGGRGIVVCDRWRVFENFLEDMGEKPQGKSIDRIDNNRGYCKENCRWATEAEQANNRSTNHQLTFNGVTKNISEWGLTLGIDQDTISARIRAGWSTDQALSTPVKNRPNKRLLTFEGVTKGIREWEIDKGFIRGTLRSRVVRGWSTDRAILTPIRTDSRNLDRHKK